MFVLTSAVCVSCMRLVDHGFLVPQVQVDRRLSQRNAVFQIPELVILAYYVAGLVKHFYFF